jgi:hypothetical protein
MGKNGAFIGTIETKTDVPFNFTVVSLLEFQDLLLALPTEKVTVSPTTKGLPCE